MKKTLFVLVSMITALLLNAQSGSQNLKYAEITFETDVHDFDTLEHAANGTYEFKFTNTGKEPLIISNAQGSCGCTVPLFPKDKVILPGKSEFIKVTYDTKRKGSFTKTVTVFSNAKTGTKVLTIKGYVKPKPEEVFFPVGTPQKNGMTPYE
jgi:Protein of unknown function (DUF1573)